MTFLFEQTRVCNTATSLGEIMRIQRHPIAHCGVLLCLLLITTGACGCKRSGKSERDPFEDFFKDQNIDIIKKDFSEVTSCPIKKVSVSTDISPSIANHGVGEYTARGCGQEVAYGCHRGCRGAGFKLPCEGAACGDGSSGEARPTESPPHAVSP
jgi:hypothetical protein